INYLNFDKAKADGQAVEKTLNRQLDALVQKDLQLYGRLREGRTRNDFVRFLCEIGASGDQAKGPRAQRYLAQQGAAHNAGTGTGITHSQKRFVSGEASGSTGGTLLERMIVNSGRLAG